jgi:hypothetical protein
MRELFAALPEDPAPPMRPGYLDTVLTLGRRSVRRRSLGAAAVWVIVALALAVVAMPFVRPPDLPGAPSSRPGLPDHFAGYSLLTRTVATAPPGRAIALYGYGNGETFNMFQSLVVGADADTYRRVDAMEDRESPSALLSPAGTQVLLGDNRGMTSDLILVDLTTGKRRSIPLGDPVGVRLLAWSPDGRYVAYGAASITNTEDQSRFVDYEVARTGTLRLLDLSTGRSAEVAALKPASAAAFAPDSRRLAVQVGQTAHVIDLDGRETGNVRVPSGRGLAANVAWSPDGRFLATVPWAADGPGVFLTEPVSVDFIALDGSTPPAPVPDVVRLLGWRSASTLVVAAVNDRTQLSLAEVPIDGGVRQTLSRFDTGSTCEFGMQNCHVVDLQLATGLLSEMAVRRAGSPQRGPWPPGVTVPTASLVLGAALVLWRRVRRF